MILGIDTDVFKAASRDGECLRFILDIDKQIEDDNPTVKLAVGREVDFLNEYKAFYDDSLGNAEHYFPLRVLKAIFDNEIETVQLSTHCPVWLQPILDSFNCKIPLEPQLISMGANIESELGSENTLTAVFVGPHSAFNPRGLYVSKAKRKIEHEVSRISKFRVKFVSDPDIWEERPHPRSREFELLSARALQQIYRKTYRSELRLEVPDLVRSRVRGKDIDVYGFDSMSNRRRVWVAECKLRLEGNERRKIKKDQGVQQLLTRLDAAREYELSQGETDIKGFIISNAHEMDSDAWKIAVEYQEKHGVEILFLRANLTKRWSQSVNWNILSLDIIQCNRDSGPYLNKSFRVKQ